MDQLSRDETASQAPDPGSTDSQGPVPEQARWAALTNWPRELWALLGAGLLIGGWYLFNRSAGFPRTVVADLLLLVTSGVAAGICWRTGARGGAAARPWMWLGFGCLAWFLGQLVRSGYDLLFRVPAPYPSLADIGFLALFPVFITGLGLIVRATSSGAPTVEIVLDSLIVATVSGIVAYWFLLGPMFRTGSPTAPALVTSLLWLVGTFVLLGLTFVAFVWSTRDIDRRPLAMLLLGTGTFCLANVLSLRVLIDGSSDRGSPIDLGWNLGFLLVAAAAIMAERSHVGQSISARPNLQDPSRNTRTTITIASVLLGTWLAAYVSLLGQPDPIVAFGIASIGLLMAARLTFASRQSRQLGERTRQRDELERQALVARATEAAMAHRADELARSNAELEQFAYVASHDLQEPLRMVSSYTQLLARRYRGQLDDDADEFIGYAVDGVTRMQQLINDLLAYSRVGRQEQSDTPVALATILAQTQAALHIAIEETGATITHGPLPEVISDPAQLSLVFQNLIANAIKFRGADPPLIQIAAHRDGAFWRISVRDNGIGMEAQYAERIFLLFQRLHTRAEYQGTGIGLAICKKIVERQGGRIWVESEPGRGATFWFTIPGEKDR